MQDQSTVRTFLFTDIEGSTRLWAREPERMQPALARHDALARAAVEGHDGIVVKTTGDGVYAVFEDPVDGVNAALQLQLALADPAATGGLPLRVRCGLHAGVVERRDDDYFGSAVNRAARIMGTAHGGQVLLSQAVAALVTERLPAGVVLHDLGVVRLRDLASPERIHQLVHPQLRHDFPALRSLEATPNNLPPQISSFIGREHELAEARRLLAGTRLLTVLGVGGIGKTRLSLQVAADALETYPDGVWFVELAPIVDPALVPATVAQVLGVQEDPDTPLVQAIGAHLGSRRVLLVLDNCEHLIDACAKLVDALLRAGPEFRILASSREPLHVPGEQTYSLPPLSLPTVGIHSGSTPRSDAVQLFVERARLQQPHFAMTDRNSDTVAQICARLDGIPLALELAAARVGVLPVEKIAERLDDRFRLLSGGSRTALPRQQTLRALIDWSYDLLGDAEKVLFARLAVFAGGWTLDAAERVAARDGIAQEDVLDLLTGLVRKSLVVPDDSGERYRMLETIREYARDRLRGSGEGVAVGRRHRDYFLALAEQAEPELDGSPEQPAWLARLDLEHDNLRAALAWSLDEAERTEAELRLCGALCRFWACRGHAGEGCSWCAAALARGAGSAGTRARAKTLNAAGTLAWRLGDITAAWAMMEQALILSRELRDRAQEGRALSNLGGVAIHRTDFAAAQTMLEQAVIIHRELGNRTLEGRAFNNLAALAISRGDDEAAKAPLERALAISRESGNRMEEATATGHLGALAQRRGDYAAAQALHEQALAIAHEFGVREFEIEEHRHLAEIAVVLGDVKAGCMHFSQALVASRDLHNQHEIAETLESMMALAVETGACERASGLAGAADAVRDAIATPRSPAEQQHYDAVVSRCSEVLGAATHAAAVAAGRALSCDHAVAAALAWLQGEQARREP